MLEPRGPLPPQIYRRRRIAALAVVAVFVLVIGVVGWLVGTAGDGDHPTQAAKQESVDPSIDLVPTTSASPSVSPSTPAAGESQAPAVDPSAEPQPADPSAPLESTAPTSVPPATPAPVPANGLCPDQNMKVVLYLNKAEYQAGERPEFTIAVTNAGLAECTRDVGKDMQNITVRSLDGTKYVWSANDCGPDSTVTNKKFAPGEQFKDSIVWTGLSSSPGCKTKREAVAPGAYQATAVVGTIQSAPITFNVYPESTPAPTPIP